MPTPDETQVVLLRELIATTRVLCILQMGGEGANFSISSTDLDNLVAQELARMKGK